MSHFTVLVIGTAPDRALAPFHEYECTGVDDEYVIDVDETEQRRAEFESAEQEVVCLADGTRYSLYDPRFYPSGNQRVLPEGSEVRTMPAREAFSFADWLEHYYGIVRLRPSLTTEQPTHYFETDAEGNVTRVICHTNPNAKWDWWQVGGRWAGFFQLKGEYAEAIRHRRALLEKGLPIPESLLQKLEGIEHGQRSWTNADEILKVCRVDAAPKGAIDFEAMRREAGDKAGERYDTVYAVLGEHTHWTSWKDMLAAHENADDAREAYHAQPALKAIAAARDNPDIGFFFTLDPFLCSRDEFVQRAKQGAGVPYALIKDGEWAQKGETEEVPEDEWATRVATLLDELPDDAQLTLVDCHI